MKTILCPTDFSPHAENAAEIAAFIAEKSSAQLIFLNSFWVPVYNSDTPAEVRAKERRMRHESLRNLLEIERKVKKDRPFISTSIMTSNGFTADAIAKAAKENMVDLVVMGTKGATGLKKVIMGSNTVDVIDKVDCPLMAVPELTKEIRFEKILFASNFSEHDLEEIDFLIDFAKLFDSELIITHVTQEDFIIETADRAILQRLKKDVKLKTHYSNLRYRLLKGDPIDELKIFSLEHQIDLIAMVTSQKHFLNKIFNRSYTRQMAFHLETPLLVLHNVEE